MRFIKQLFFLLAASCTTLASLAQDGYTELANKYISQYKDAAIEEEQRSGVPAAITLGQGILETQAGASELCTNANNHFGIKCKKEWQGETYTYTDDHPDECFRKYSCARESYKDHSDYLKTSKRYATLFALRQEDYAGWAKGLKRCGYATNPHYAQQLIKIIEDFHLQDYTYTALNNMQEHKAGEVIPTEYVTVTAAVKNIDTPYSDAAKDVRSALGDGVFEMNGLRAVFAHKGDVLLEQAIKYNIRYARLLEYNDLPDAPLEADMFVYLEKKNTKGGHEEHEVKDGESLLTIAQQEGMQLKQLLLYNQLKPNETPAPGEILNLQQQVLHKPALAQRNNAVRKAPEVETSLPGEYIYKNPESATQKQDAEVSVPNNKPETVAISSDVIEKQREEQHIEKPLSTSTEKHEEKEVQDEFSILKAKLDKVVYSLPIAEENIKDTKNTSTQAAVNPAAHKPIKYYTVQKGDTGFSIAKKYSISMKQLRDWNHLDFETIKVGQKLIVKQ